MSLAPVFKTDTSSSPTAGTQPPPAPVPAVSPQLAPPASINRDNQTTTGANMATDRRFVAVRKTQHTLAAQKYVSGNATLAGRALYHKIERLDECFNRSPDQAELGSVTFFSAVEFEQRVAAELGGVQFKREDTYRLFDHIQGEHYARFYKLRKDRTRKALAGGKNEGAKSVEEKNDFDAAMRHNNGTVLGRHAVAYFAAGLKISPEKRAVFARRGTLQQSICQVLDYLDGSAAVRVTSLQASLPENSGRSALFSGYVDVSVDSVGVLKTVPHGGDVKGEAPPMPVAQVKGFPAMKALRQARDLAVRRRCFVAVVPSTGVHLFETEAAFRQCQLEEQALTEQDELGGEGKRQKRHHHKSGSRLRDEVAHEVDDNVRGVRRKGSTFGANSPHISAQVFPACRLVKGSSDHGGGSGSTNTVTVDVSGGRTRLRTKRLLRKLFGREARKAAKAARDKRRSLRNQCKRFIVRKVPKVGDVLENGADIGLSLGRVLTGGVEITAIAEGSQSDRSSANLRVGDRLCAVNGSDARRVGTTAEVVALIQQHIGSPHPFALEFSKSTGAQKAAKQKEEGGGNDDPSSGSAAENVERMEFLPYASSEDDEVGYSDSESGAEDNQDEEHPEWDDIDHPHTATFTFLDNASNNDKDTTVDSMIAFMRAIAFLEASAAYTRACWQSQCSHLPQWVHALHCGDASTLMVSKDHITGQDEGSGLLHSRAVDVEPDALDAVRESLETLERSRHVLAEAVRDVRVDGENRRLAQTRLHRVVVRGLGLTSDHLKALERVVESCGGGDLHELDVAGCKFVYEESIEKGGAVSSLVTLLRALHTTPGMMLKRLRLSSCSLEDDQTEQAFEDALRTSTRGRKRNSLLGLYTNEMSNGGLSNLSAVPMGYGLFGLDYLDLSGNLLTGKACALVLSSFKAGSLRGIDLSGSRVEDTLAVVTALWRHKSSLESLILARCDISSGVLAALVGGLGSKTGASQLQELDLRGNVLDVQGKTQNNRRRTRTQSWLGLPAHGMIQFCLTPLTNILSLSLSLCLSVCLSFCLCPSVYCIYLFLFPFPRIPAVVAILVNALSSKQNALKTAHMGGLSREKYDLDSYESMQKQINRSGATEQLIDFGEMQHHLTHRRFGRNPYGCGRLTLTRDPRATTLATGSSLPCACRLVTSHLVSLFQPVVYATELGLALGVHPRHFDVNLADGDDSVNGRCDVRVRVSGVPSLTLGDRNANRQVVSRLVARVGNRDPTVARLRIVELTMVKREMVAETELFGQPRITDTLNPLEIELQQSPSRRLLNSGAAGAPAMSSPFGGLVGPVLTPAQASARIMSRLEEVDRPWLSMLAAQGGLASQEEEDAAAAAINAVYQEEEVELPQEDTSGQHQGANDDSLEAFSSSSSDEEGETEVEGYRPRRTYTSSDEEAEDNQQAGTSTRTKGKGRKPHVFDESKDVLMAAAEKHLARQDEEKNPSGMLGHAATASATTVKQKQAHRRTSGRRASIDMASRLMQPDENLDKIAEYEEKQARLREEQTEREAAQVALETERQARLSEVEHIAVRKWRPPYAPPTDICSATDLLYLPPPPSPELSTTGSQGPSTKLPPLPVLSLLTPLPVDLIRLRLYEAIRTRDIVSLKRALLAHDALDVEDDSDDDADNSADRDPDKRLEEWELRSCRNVIDCHTAALAQLDDRLVLKTQATEYGFDSRALRGYCRELEAAIAACAAAGFRLNAVNTHEQLQEALSTLASCYQRCHDTGRQRLHRQLLGAMFGRDMKALRVVIEACMGPASGEAKGNLLPHSMRLSSAAPLLRAARDLLGLMEAAAANLEEGCKQMEQRLKDLSRGDTADADADAEEARHANRIGAMSAVQACLPVVGDEAAELRSVYSWNDADCYEVAACPVRRSFALMLYDSGTRNLLLLLTAAVADKKWAMVNELRDVTGRCEDAWEQDPQFASFLSLQTTSKNNKSDSKEADEPFDEVARSEEKGENSHAVQKGDPGYDEALEQACREFFSGADKDGGGTISPLEFTKHLKKIGKMAKKAAKNSEGGEQKGHRPGQSWFDQPMSLYQKIDDDNSGQIDVDEFIEFVKSEGDTKLRHVLMGMEDKVPVQKKRTGGATKLKSVPKRATTEAGDDGVGWPSSMAALFRRAEETERADREQLASRAASELELKNAREKAVAAKAKAAADAARIAKADAELKAKIEAEAKLKAEEVRAASDKLHITGLGPGYIRAVEDMATALAEHEHEKRERSAMQYRTSVAKEYAMGTDDSAPWRDPVDIALAQMLSATVGNETAATAATRSAFAESTRLLTSRSGVLTRSRRTQAAASMVSWASLIGLADKGDPLPLFRTIRMCLQHGWAESSALLRVARAYADCHSATLLVGTAFDAKASKTSGAGDEKEADEDTSVKEARAAIESLCTTSRMLLQSEPYEYFRMRRFPGLAANVNKRTNRTGRGTKVNPFAARNASSPTAAASKYNPIVSGRRFRPLMHYTAIEEPGAAVARKLFSLLSSALYPARGRGGLAPGGAFSELRIWLAYAVNNTATTALAGPTLASECYAQCCKILFGRTNKDPVAAVRAWRCLACLLHLVPVPATLSPYLVAFLARQADSLKGIERKHNLGQRGGSSPSKVKKPGQEPPEVEAARASRMLAGLVRSGALSTARARHPLPAVQRDSHHASRMGPDPVIPTERELASVFVLDRERHPKTARVRIVVPGLHRRSHWRYAHAFHSHTSVAAASVAECAIDLDVPPFTAVGDLVAKVVKRLTSTSNSEGTFPIHEPATGTLGIDGPLDASCGHHAWHDFALFLPGDTEFTEADEHYGEYGGGGLDTAVTSSTSTGIVNIALDAATRSMHMQHRQHLRSRASTNHTGSPYASDATGMRQVPKRVRNEEDARWCLTQYFGLVHTTHRRRWTLLLLPTTSFRGDSVTLSRRLASSALGLARFDWCRSRLRSGALGYERSAMAYCVALVALATYEDDIYARAVRAKHSPWLNNAGPFDQVGIVAESKNSRTGSAGRAGSSIYLASTLFEVGRAVLPQWCYQGAEAQAVATAAASFLSFMAPPPPLGEHLHVDQGRFRHALVAYVQCWPLFGTKTFDGLTLADDSAAAGGDRSPVAAAAYSPPRSPRASTARQEERVDLTLTVSGASCAVYPSDPTRQQHAGATATSVVQMPVFSFDLCELQSVRLVDPARDGAAWQLLRHKDHVEFDLGPSKGRAVFRFASADDALGVVGALQDAGAAVLRRGVGGAEPGPATCFWWLEFMFPSLPPPPLPPGLGEQQLWNASEEALARLVLLECARQGLVWGEVVNDLEAVCGRVKGGEKVTVPEFTAAMQHLKMLPLQVSPERLAEILDPDGEEGGVLVSKFLEILERLMMDDNPR